MVLQEYFKNMDNKDLEIYFEAKRDRDVYLGKIISNKKTFMDEMEKSENPIEQAEWASKMHKDRAFRNKSLFRGHKEKLFVVFDGGVFDSTKSRDC